MSARGMAAGDGAGVRARTADLPVPFDDRDALAGFRRLDGGLLSSGSGADHHNVEVFDVACVHVKLSAVA